MIRHLSILVFLSGMPSISNPASVVNIDILSTAQEQDKAGSPHGTSDQPSDQRDNQSYSIQKINKPFSLYESHSSIGRGHAADIFNRSGLLKNRPFEAERQEDLSESNKVLESIKTSLKAINSEWNDIENWANLFLEEGGIYSLSHLATDQMDLQVYSPHQRESVDAQINKLANLVDLQDSAVLEQQLEDQSLLYKLLFFISIPHLLKLISANLTTLIVITLLWLCIKGVIKFARWKMKKKKRSHIKKKRSIDGFTKY